jgi:hypothetical protein
MQRVSGYVAAVSGAMLMVLFPVLAQAWQCVEQKPLLTSDVSVQIFFTETPVAGVELELSTEGAGSKVVAAAKTDESGYVHFVGVSPGRYRLQWTSAPYPSLSRRLRVVGPGQGPKRLLVVGLTMMCPNVCSVGDPGGALKKAPKC